MCENCISERFHGCGHTTKQTVIKLCKEATAHGWQCSGKDLKERPLVSKQDPIDCEDCYSDKSVPAPVCEVLISKRTHVCGHSVTDRVIKRCGSHDGGRGECEGHRMREVYMASKRVQEECEACRNWDGRTL
jgi:hypothetical protein